MQTTADKEKNQLIKRFHTLIGKAGISAEEKAVILQQYGAGSSTDLSVYDLIDVCTRLDYMASPELAEADKWRKRLIAAIGGWLKAMNKEGGINAIKSIACRAAGVNNFNRITPERLRSLYYAFQKKQKDLAFAEQLTADELNYLTISN